MNLKNSVSHVIMISFEMVSKQQVTANLIMGVYIICTYMDHSVIRLYQNLHSYEFLFEMW